MTDNSADKLEERLAIAETNLKQIASWSDEFNSTVTRRFDEIMVAFRETENRLYAKLEGDKESRRITPALIISFFTMLIGFISIGGLFHSQSLKPIIERHEKHVALPAHIETIGDLSFLKEKNETLNQNIDSAIVNREDSKRLLLTKIEELNVKINTIENQLRQDMALKEELRIHEASGENHPFGTYKAISLLRAEIEKIKATIKID